jgi:hypothetical protein
MRKRKKPTWPLVVSMLGRVYEIVWTAEEAKP